MFKPDSRLVSVMVELLSPQWPLALFSTAAGTASGFATAGLLATVNACLHSRGIPVHTLTNFGLLFAAKLICEIVSNFGNSIVGQRIIATLRNDLTAKILRAPIAQIEQYQHHRLLTSLNQDIGALSNVTSSFSSFAIAVAVALGCFGYLAWLSPTMSLVTLAAIVAGTLTTNLARRYGYKRFSASREEEDRLQSYFRHIIDGSKEMRMHRRRRALIYRGNILKSTARIARLASQAIVIFYAANAWSSALFFLLIGILLLLHRDASALDKATLSGFVLVLLYAKSPLDQVMAQFSLFSRAQVAIARLRDLAARFDNPEAGLRLDEGLVVAVPPIGTIELREAAYVHPAVEGGERFELGPINLTIRSGEILFITGENGCGKTTLLKVLLGLYMPTRGELIVDNEPLRSDRLDDYRQCFATVFSDYFLFDELVLPAGVSIERAHAYLERFDLERKVSIVEGRFSTTDLSTGQRKRLALIHAWMDGRQMLVFDEWAADQDPSFRRTFYTEILPMLKREGRTVIAISHDDRYFHVADRRIELRKGKVVATF